MQGQIEFVMIDVLGGPMDGLKAPYGCSMIAVSFEDHMVDIVNLPDNPSHIYHYDQTQSKYIYKGVEQ